MSDEAASGTWKTPKAGLKFEPLFKKYEAKYNLPLGLLSRVAFQESSYNPEAVSPVGAQGLFQFMPLTAADLNIDPFDAESATEGAARYLSWLYKSTGNWTLALAAYNWGIGNVLRKGLDLAPEETINYYSEITRDTGLS